MRGVIWDPATDEFSVSELPLPSPGPQDVLVKVEACGLNPVDSKIHLWHGLVGKMPANWVTGLDVAGEIVAVGSAVEQWQVGQHVLYHGDMFRPCGGFAEYALHDCRTLIPQPDVDAEIAAATPCAAWTAWRTLVDKLRIAESGCNSLFIAGGSGGVGSFAIQIARHLGVQTLITTCSAANHDYVRSLGASHVLDYRQPDLKSEVMAITRGRGVDAAIDCVGAETADTDIVCASVLGFEGQMVELVSVVRPEAYPDAFMNGLSFHQLSLGSGHRHGEDSRKRLRQAGIAVSQLLTQGELTVPRLQVISLPEVCEALKQMREQHTVGKLVYKPSSQ